MRSTLNSTVYTAQALHWAVFLLILGLCIPAARAGEWRVSREVAINLEGDVSSVMDNCNAGGSLVMGASQAGTFPQPDGLKYYQTNDWISAWIVGLSEPDVAGTVTVRYTVTYVPDSDEDEPPTRLVLLLGALQKVWLAEPSVQWPHSCCAGDVGSTRASAVSNAFDQFQLEEEASLGADCVFVGEGDIRQAQAVTIRSLEMVRDPAPPHWWSGKLRGGIRYRDL